MKRVARAGFLLFCLLGVAAPVFAQRDHEIPIQFDFINPGARSLSFGGAFIGLADDATASSTNPAGLPQLTRAEVSVEVRGWDFVTSFVQGGRLLGTATQRGIDTVAGPTFGETQARVAGLSFLSFVYPKGMWRVAGYRQEASRLRADARTEGAFFVENNQQGVLTNFRELPTSLDRSIDVVNYGGTVAYRMGIVSVGAGVQASQLSLESSLIGYDTPADFFAAATYTDPLYVNSQSSEDWGFGASAGVLIIPNRTVQFGASYRRGAKFSFEGALDYEFFPELAGPYEGEFNVPDNFGAGVAVRPSTSLTLVADINRVMYSDLTSFVQTQVRFIDSPADRQLYSIDDATEIHLGAEYVLTRFRWLPSARVGFWRETEHAVTYTGSDVLYTATRTLAKDINHFSIGAGVAPTTKLELNAGFDFSDRANTMSFSAILRFQ